MSWNGVWCPSWREEKGETCRPSKSIWMKQTEDARVENKQQQNRTASTSAIMFSIQIEKIQRREKVEYFIANIPDQWMRIFLTENWLNSTDVNNNNNRRWKQNWLRNWCSALFFLCWCVWVSECSGLSQLFSMLSTIEWVFLWIFQLIQMRNVLFNYQNKTKKKNTQRWSMQLDSRQAHIFCCRPF